MSTQASACIVGPHTQVNGHVAGDGQMVIEGRVTGTMHLGDHLLLEPTGQADADVQVRCATLRGRFAGQLTVAEHLDIDAGAELSGPVQAETLTLAAGARVHGHIDMPIALPDALH